MTEPPDILLSFYIKRLQDTRLYSQCYFSISTVVLNTVEPMTMIPTLHIFAYGVVALLAGKLIQWTWQRQVILANTERLGVRAAVIPTWLPLGMHPPFYVQHD